VPKLFTITPEWTEQQWFNTGGTRAKKYLLHPDGKFFFFKRSQYKPASDKKPEKDFKYEFWNEIISYEVGSLLGFKMLRYDMAIDGEIMGCISESMVNSENQELIEGIKYLQAYSPDFDPGNKEHRVWYTFNLIEGALQSAKIDHFIDDLLEIIVLDATIGNGDRHQENWAVVTHQRLITDAVELIENRGEIRINKLLKLLLTFLKRAEKKMKEQNQKIPKLSYIIDKQFAPIYDNGSSLGRELLDEKVNLYITSNEELTKYILRGPSEIHWENQKVSHFQLIRNLLNSKYEGKIKEIINRIVDKYSRTEIERIIQEVDKDVPETHTQYRIPESRKRLIFKIITLRFEMLRTITNEGV